MMISLDLIVRCQNRNFLLSERFYEKHLNIHKEKVIGHGLAVSNPSRLVVFESIERHVVVVRYFGSPHNAPTFDVVHTVHRRSAKHNRRNRSECLERLVDTHHI